MASFICLLSTRPTAGVAEDIALDWQSSGICRMAIIDDDCGPPVSVIRLPFGLAAGTVRLDNRRDISRLAHTDPSQSDLAIVAAALARDGENCIKKFEGDFAFAYWDDRRHVLIAARDALGIRTLYRRQDASTLGFASRARLLATDSDVSLDYIADYIASGTSLITPYAGVARVSPASYQVVTAGTLTEHQYWSPHQFKSARTIDGREAVEEFRALFANAVRAPLTEPVDCWSQLSGGVDSSSIVSMAGWLGKTDPSVRPLAGTITYVDTIGSGDERAFSDTVVRDWPHRHEQIVDFGDWQESEESPPLTDEPDSLYASVAREQHVCQVVRSAGGRMLLSGVGPDHYLYGNWLFFADWIVQGRFMEAVREMYRLSVLGRFSFWKFAYRHALRPYLPNPPARDQWPTWIDPRFAHRYPVAERTGIGLHTRRRPAIGRRFVDDIANQLDGINDCLFRGVIGETLDVRYPFLHRPLVEFCLQLPPDLIVRPREHKWILREAMRGILPDEVRQRKSKGWIDGRIDRWLTRERARLELLLERSIVGELGCIDVRATQHALATSDTEAVDKNRLVHVLTLETWLAARSGRWTAGALV